MIQIAAQAFGISHELVHVSETASDKVPNTPPTAASVGSDIHGMAVLNACEKIKARLKPFKLRHPDWSFQTLCEAAWFERIDMAAEGYYATPKGSEYDFDADVEDNSDRGEMWNYFCFGLAMAEVTVDTKTGSFQVEKADVIMDVGQSLNPAIDIGQVEGAFIQGMGYFTTEELIWGDSAHPWARQGVLANAGPHYGVPTPSDVPLDFRVTLWSANEANPYAVHSSKAVGEPPTFLSASVFFAIKDAITASRSANGVEGFFRLDAPATYEKIRLLCVDDHTRMVGVDSEFIAKGSY